MADTAAVSDTHALVFHGSGGRHLGPKASRLFAAAEKGDALINVPAVVVWEVSQLARAVRINLRLPAREFFADLFSNPAYQFHDLGLSQLLDADDLRFTRNPFDSLVCAAARDLGLPLITRDRAIHESGCVKVIW